MSVHTHTHIKINKPDKMSNLVKGIWNVRIIIADMKNSPAMENVENDQLENQSAINLPLAQQGQTK